MEYSKETFISALKQANEIIQKKGLFTFKDSALIGSAIEVVSDQKSSETDVDQAIATLSSGLAVGLNASPLSLQDCATLYFLIVEHEKSKKVLSQSE